jgi:glutaminyl-tRNA synthetase
MSEERSLNFLEEIIESDISNGKHNGRVHTRFPPEPNGYLHIGHASSICLNFGLAKKYNGLCNLRFDDTNPTTEETEYVESIKADIKWLGFDWANELYASDYFETLYQYALQLIEKGLAYVDDSSSEEMAALKGDIGVPGTPSVYRERTVEENLQLFKEMRAGKYPDGAKVLRAKIDMAHPNLLFRDPILYRIKHAHHHRTGNEWCIYPMYDFAHGQSDSIEQITHSICTLEFIHHRPLYDWFIQELDIFPSHQYEFARRSVTYMITSKRKLLQLVNENVVDGWDDPRMPTISGMRRRGYPAAAIRQFCDMIGVGKRENIVDIEMLEFCVREQLNKTANRAMVVLDPIKVVITNYEGSGETLIADNNTENPEAGVRDISFSNTIYIERDDFMLEPPKKFFRLGPGLSVRLKHAYIITCDSYELDENGTVKVVYCTYHKNSKSGSDTSGIAVKGVIHWVNANDAVPVEIRHYNRLFTVEDPANAEGEFLDHINPNSLVINTKALAEPSVLNAKVGDAFQFLRKGYFSLDSNSSKEKVIFNETVGLKDSFSKTIKK